MKRVFLPCMAIAVCIAACSENPQIVSAGAIADEAPVVEAPANMVEISIAAGISNENDDNQPLSKTKFEDLASFNYMFDGNEEISVSSASTPYVRMSNTSGEGKTAVFNGSVPEDMLSDTKFWSVMPYSAFVNEAKDGQVCINIPANQKAVKDAFDPDANVMVASSDDINNLSYKSAVTFLRIINPKGYNFKSITLKGRNHDNDRNMAGELWVDPSTGVIKSFGTNTSAEVTISGDITEGTYIMAFRNMVMAKGFTLTAVDAEDYRYEYVYSGDHTYYRNHIVGIKPVWKKMGKANKIVSFKKDGKTYEIEMVHVEAGNSFYMGASSSDFKDLSDTDKSKYPAHQVKVGSFYMAKFELSQALWYAVMGDDGDPLAIYPKLKNDRYPMIFLSYNKVVAFIAKLNSITGLQFRMPTEAEWEYAARGGVLNTAPAGNDYPFSGDYVLKNVGFYYENSDNKFYPCGSKAPNDLGIYDMSGNVSEFCSDWYGDYPTSVLSLSPTGPATGTSRVIRGGDYASSETDCRVFVRSSVDPAEAMPPFGCRLALTE